MIHQCVRRHFLYRCSHQKKKDNKSSCTKDDERARKTILSAQLHGLKNSSASKLEQRNQILIKAESQLSPIERHKENMCSFLTGSHFLVGTALRCYNPMYGYSHTSVVRS